MTDDFKKQLDNLKVLSGIYQPYKIDEEPNQENLSHIGTKKGAYQRKHNVEPGTKEWFKLWFARPYLTGEDPIGRKK